MQRRHSSLHRASPFSPGLVEQILYNPWRQPASGPRVDVRAVRRTLANPSGKDSTPQSGVGFFFGGVLRGAQFGHDPPVTGDRHALAPLNHAEIGAQAVLDLAYT